mmetsp:Transcript_13486/g.19436  ORF Transcript_13486/g.19436 Transcript_13486/m.19436 type:complete len:91 (-) Transcript_13486:33-305(-)
MMMVVCLFSMNMSSKPPKLTEQGPDMGKAMVVEEAEAQQPELVAEDHPDVQFEAAMDVDVEEDNSKGVRMVELIAVLTLKSNKMNMLSFC